MLFEAPKAPIMTWPGMDPIWPQSAMVGPVRNDILTSPSVVLDTYLRALVAGNCATAHAAATSAFATDAGELCGDVKVSAFSAREDKATPGPNEVVYVTTLTTKGSSDGTIAPGETVWFYGLEREGGEWRLVSGGSGP